MEVTDLKKALDNGEIEAAQALLGKNIPICSYPHWDTWFEQHTLFGVLTLLNNAEDLNKQLALILGYAVLQHMQKSWCPDLFLSNSEIAHRDFLASILMGLEQNHLIPDETFELSMTEAMSAWAIGTGIESPWSILSIALEYRPFSEKISIHTLESKVREACLKRLEALFNSDDVSMLFSFDASDSHSDMCRTHRDEDTNFSSSTNHVLQLSTMAKESLEYSYLVGSRFNKVGL